MLKLSCFQRLHFEYRQQAYPTHQLKLVHLLIFQGQLAPYRFIVTGDASGLSEVNFPVLVPRHCGHLSEVTDKGSD